MTGKTETARDLSVCGRDNLKNHFDCDSGYYEGQTDSPYQNGSCSLWRDTYDSRYDARNDKAESNKAGSYRKIFSWTGVHSWFL